VGDRVVNIDFKMTTQGKEGSATFFINLLVFFLFE